MDDSQVIVSLTRRNLELQAEIDKLTILYDDAIRARNHRDGWIDDMQKALDYYGHPGNMASAIKDLKDN